MFLKTFLALVLTASTGMPAMAIDLAPLWDFNQPELSEQRFQKAIVGATADDQLVLRTQRAKASAQVRVARALHALQRVDEALVKQLWLELCDAV